MKKIISILVLVISFYSCKEKATVEEVANKATSIKNNVISIAKVEVDKKKLFLNQIEGKWYLNKEPFNGYSLKYHNNGTVIEKLGFYNGKREGKAKRWSENGVLRAAFTYHQNKLEGVYETWWENGAISEKSTYANGFKEGEEKQWYPDGQLAKWRHLSKGKEKGMQQAWLKNGTLYVNYEAKNGRVFGLKRANLCYQLKDEVVTRN
jgi:antitoxin component YwqK of YwqJK toxin-antitoxin module